MKHYTSIALSVVLLFSLGFGAAPAAASTFAKGDAVEVPDVIGEPANLAKDALETLKLDVELDGQGRSVFSKKNWVVVSQKPKAGTKVSVGDEIKLVLIKKSEIVTDAKAVVLCKKEAKDTKAFPYPVHWDLLDFISVENDLGVTVRQFGTMTDASGSQVEVSIRCEYTGTNKKPKLVLFEVLPV